jgi:hypothetical protein
VASETTEARRLERTAASRYAVSPERAGGATGLRSLPRSFEDIALGDPLRSLRLLRSLRPVAPPACSHGTARSTGMPLAPHRSALRSAFACGNPFLPSHRVPPATHATSRSPDEGNGAVWRVARFASPGRQPEMERFARDHGRTWEGEAVACGRGCHARRREEGWGEAKDLAASDAARNLDGLERARSPPPPSLPPARSRTTAKRDAALLAFPQSEYPLHLWYHQGRCVRVPSIPSASLRPS